MARRGKFNSLETQLASSILYYDEEEMNKFFSVYDSLCKNENILIDGIFDTFVNYLRDFRNFDDNTEIRKNNLINYLNVINDQSPNKNQREIFELWFSKVLETDTPMELADDILYHFIWEEFKQSIEQIDLQNISFKEKLEIRPRPADIISEDQEVVKLSDIKIDSEYGESYTSGLPEFDKVLKFYKTNLVIIAARPGVGKSLFMIQMAIANALAGKKVLYLSLEMSKELLYKRMMNVYANENLKAQHSDENGDLNINSYNQAVEKIQNTPRFKSMEQNLGIYENKSSSADSILSSIEKRIEKDKYEVIFIDYLQIMRYIKLDEWSSLRKLTRDLKSLAFRTNTLFVTASQVSRSSEDSGLYLSDLFGSSTIEADADTVIGMETIESRRTNDRNIVNFKTLKVRDGSIPEIKYMIDYSIGKIFLYDGN